MYHQNVDEKCVIRDFFKENSTYLIDLMRNEKNALFRQIKSNDCYFDDVKSSQLKSPNFLFDTLILVALEHAQSKLGVSVKGLDQVLRQDCVHWFSGVDEIEELKKEVNEIQIEAIDIHRASMKKALHDKDSLIKETIMWMIKRMYELSLEYCESPSFNDLSLPDDYFSGVIEHELFYLGYDGWELEDIEPFSLKCGSSLDGFAKAYFNKLVPTNVELE